MHTFVGGGGHNAIPGALPLFLVDINVGRKEGRKDLKDGNQGGQGNQGRKGGQGTKSRKEIKGGNQGRKEG